MFLSPYLYFYLSSHQPVASVFMLPSSCRPRTPSRSAGTTLPRPRLGLSDAYSDSHLSFPLLNPLLDALLSLLSDYEITLIFWILAGAFSLPSREDRYCQFLTHLDVMNYEPISWFNTTYPLS